MIAGAIFVLFCVGGWAAWWAHGKGGPWAGAAAWFVVILIFIWLAPRSGLY